MVVSLGRIRGRGLECLQLGLAKVEGVRPGWRLDKVASFCGIGCGAASLSFVGGDDLAFGKALDTRRPVRQ